MTITRIWLTDAATRHEGDDGFSFEVDPDMESGWDETGVWFWSYENLGYPKDTPVKRTIPWTSIAWVESL